MLRGRRTDGRVLWRIVIGKNKTYRVIRVKYAIFCPILTKFRFRQIFIETTPPPPNIKFHGKLSQWEPLWYEDRRKSGRADMRKVKRAPRDRANAPNKYGWSCPRHEGTHIAPFLLNLGARWRSVVTSHPGRFTPPPPSKNLDIPWTWGWVGLEPV
jgi:hypothetical protein